MITLIGSPLILWLSPREVFSSARSASTGGLVALSLSQVPMHRIRRPRITFLMPLFHSLARLLPVDWRGEQASKWELPASKRYVTSVVMESNEIKRRSGNAMLAGGLRGLYLRP